MQPSLKAEKQRWPQEMAVRVATELCAALQDKCERLIVAGSLRRGKPTVGDLELLYISKTEERPDPADMFANMTVSLVEEAIASLEMNRVLERRKNARGLQAYGPKNKLMRHVITGLPVDLFAATEENWWNYLVCRTGPALSNVAIAAAAEERGWKWNPYGPGFTSADGTQAVRMTSERQVFEFVGLAYQEPEKR